GRALPAPDAPGRGPAAGALRGRRARLSRVHALDRLAALSVERPRQPGDDEARVLSLARPDDPRGALRGERARPRVRPERGRRRLGEYPRPAWERFLATYGITERRVEQ